MATKVTVDVARFAARCWSLDAIMLVATMAVLVSGRCLATRATTVARVAEAVTRVTTA